MKDRCADHIEGIARVAEGQHDEAAERHLLTCSACSRKVEQLRSIFAAGRQRFYDAPAELVAAAKAIMPAPERRLASLLSSTTAWSGARAATDDFQLVVADGDTSVRLMYSRSGEGWEVMGKAPAFASRVELGETEVALGSDGRFSFSAPRLAETAFVIAGPEGEIFIPSAEELLSRESDRRD